MKEHVRDILNDMIDNEIKPDLATYRTLLAGYCNARQFDEVKTLIHDMTKYGLVNISTLEDPISKAFSVMGVDPLTVKVKRDNDLRNFRAEFFDELGNGLYLDTNLEQFEDIVTGILEKSLVPDFNLLVSRLCYDQNVKKTLIKIDEMALWGQELSPPVLSELVRLLHYSNWYIKAMPEQLNSMSQLFSKLGHETLNLLIQVLCKSRFMEKCMLLFDKMHRKNIPISSATFNSMLICVCEMGKISDVLYCFDLLRKGTWLPEWKTFIHIFDCLCYRQRLKELLELFDVMMMSYPDSTMHICDVFLQKLCTAGFTRVGDILINELKKRYELDETFSVKVIPSGKAFSTSVEGHYRISDLKIAKVLLSFMIRRSIRLENALDVSNQSRLKGWNHLCSTVNYELLDDLLCNGRSLEAETFFSQVLEKRQIFDTTFHNNLIRKFGQYGRLKMAVNLLDQLLKTKNIPDSSSYDCIAQGFCEHNNLNRAMEFYSEMLYRNLKPGFETCDLLIDKFCLQGYSENAEGILNSMAKLGQSPTKKMFSTVIDRYQLENNLSKASELLHRMQQHGYEPDFGTQWSIISSLSNSDDRRGSHQGFLSRLLNGSGFSEGRTQSKPSVAGTGTIDRCRPES